MREFWKTTKIMGAIRKNSQDNRPYTVVNLLERKREGLLDTGTDMSRIGEDLAKEYICSNKPLCLYGKIFNTKVEYKGEEKKT